MSDIFISYQRMASGALALLIQERLKNQYKINAYVDTTRMDGTHIQFSDRIMKAIEDSSTFVCLLGSSTLESDWIRKEIQAAYELKKHCIPVFQESYVPPEDMDESLDYLLNFDGVHIFDLRNIFLNDAINAIANLAIKQSPSPLNIFKRIRMWMAAQETTPNTIVSAKSNLIFISYRRSDSSMAAGRFYDYLVNHFENGQIFMDVDSIMPGDDFIEVLRAKLKRASMLFVIIGRDWLNAKDEHGDKRLENTNDWVRFEIKYALDNGCRIIPLLVDGAQMPAEKDLPEDIQSLARKHAVSLSAQNFRQDVDQLIKRLREAFDD